MCLTANEIEKVIELAAAAEDNRSGFPSVLPRRGVFIGETAIGGPSDSILKVQQLIDAARGGSRDALGRLLEAWRQYLLLVADHELGPDLQAKVGASDVVQETFLKAHREFANFRGQSEDELAAWLHRILVNNVASIGRRYAKTNKRDVSKEISLTGPSEADSEIALPELAGDVESPSALASNREEGMRMQDALMRLPQEYRLIIRLRHQEKRSFIEIGRLIDRSADASRKLWLRAIERLGLELGGDHETP